MIPLKEWQARGATVQLLGYDTFFIDEGRGDQDVVFLIHGFPTASWDWCKIWEPLKENFRLVASDMLGFGFTDKPYPHWYSLVEQADLMEALMRHLGLTRMHLLVHDYGVSVAQELLARQLEGRAVADYQSVCFLNGGLFPEMHRALPVQKLLLGPLGGIANTLMSKGSLERSMRKIFGQETQPSAEELEIFWTLMNHKNGKRNFNKLIRYIIDRRENRERWLGALKDTNIPVALINGSVDPVSGEHLVSHYRSAIGEPDFVKELSKIGHYPQVEDPKGVISAYISFLSLKI